MFDDDFVPDKIKDQSKDQNKDLYAGKKNKKEKICC